MPCKIAKFADEYFHGALDKAAKPTVNPPLTARHLNAANAVSIGNPVETDPELVAAVAFVAVGVCADKSCGEAQRYREDRSPRLSPGLLQAGYGAGALQMVRKIHGRTEQFISFWTPERLPSDSD